MRRLTAAVVVGFALLLAFLYWRLDVLVENPPNQPERVEACTLGILRYSSFDSREHISHDELADLCGLPVEDVVRLSEQVEEVTQP